MKKLIIYDESCPMCAVYTKGMVLFDGSGTISRIGNNHLTDTAIINQLDPQRVKHELPMVDLDGGETRYGIDTWGYAFGRCNDRIGRLLSLGWLRTILQKLYAFISYNRRIVFPPAPGRWELLDFAPEFRPGYRLAFASLLLTLAVVAHTCVRGSVDWPFFTFLISQIVVVGIYARTRRGPDWLETFLDYCAHVGVCFVIGGLPKLVGSISGADWLLPVGNALIIGQHFIRINSLQLSPWLSILFTAGLLLTING